MSRKAMEVQDVSQGYGLDVAKPTVPAGHKKTEVGVIPEDWDVWSLRQTSRGIYRGASPRPIGDSRWFDERSEIGWVRISDVTRSRRYLLSTTQKLSDDGVRRSRFIPRGSLIMSICATVGRPIETGVDACIHDGFVVFEKPELDQKFLYHILSDLEPSWSDKGQTGSQMNLNTNLIKNTEVPVPPTVEEQRAIATALDDADALLEELDHLIAKKRAIKQAIMQQLFSGQTRLPGFEGEWKTEPLGEMVSFLSGGTPPRSNESYWNGDIPWISATSLRTLYISRSESNVTREAVVAGSKMAPVGSTLLLVRGSALHKEILAGLVTAPVCFNQDVKALVPKREICSKFLTFLLHARAEDLLKLVSSAGNSAGVLDTKLLKAFEIQLPSVEEQTAIARVLSDIDSEIEALRKRHTKTAALKQAMMQELLTGRTRLIDPVNKDLSEEKARPGRRKANVYFMRSVLAAEIIDQLHNEPTFGHVKFEKVLFLVERICEVDTGSTYHRKAAGPYDNRALRSIDSQLRRQRWFDARKDKGRYRYVPLQKRGEHKSYFDRYFSGIAATFTKVVETFRGLNTERCEIVATLFSAWSDLLRHHSTVSDEMIVHEVLDNWHESKKRIPEDRWLKALAWMRDKGFVPKGVASP